MVRLYKRTSAQMRREVSNHLQNEVKVPATTTKPNVDSEDKVQAIEKKLECSKCSLKRKFDAYSCGKGGHETCTICDMVTDMINAKKYKHIKIKLELCDSE